MTFATLVGDPPNFDGWEFGCGRLDEALAKIYEDTLKESIGDDFMYVAMVMDGDVDSNPMTMLISPSIGEDVFFQVTLDKLVMDDLDDYIPGGRGRGEKATDESMDYLKRRVQGLRDLADKLERVMNGGKE